MIKCNYFLFVFLYYILNYSQVFGQCSASIESTPVNLSGCAPFGVQFRDVSTGVILSRTWDFGDGSISIGSQNPFHTYTASGSNITITGSLLVKCSNSSTSTKSFSVVVNAQPKVSFSKSANEVCAVTSTLSLTNLSTSLPGYAYFWTFGDNSSSSEFSPTHIFSASGRYNISLLAVSPDGCSQSFSDSVLVRPTPNPDFSAGNYDGCIPATIRFENTTIDPQNNIVT